MYSGTISRPGEIEKLSDKLAEEICRRGMSAPAIFVLEMYKPFVSVAGAGVAVSAPILIPLFGMKWYRTALAFLESRENMESLIKKVEELEKVKNS